MKRKKQKRVYRLSDLIAIAEQMGCRIRLEIVPLELLVPKRAAPPPPTAPSRRSEP